MPNEPFMLVSLKEEKAKKLSHVLSNKTAVKILEYLAGKDATESQIAKALKIPLSTVNYNMKQLLEAKLVTSDEFHYSEKGKEVSHYKLANKYIIIAPTAEDETFLQHLKKFVPAFVGLAVIGAVVQGMRWFRPLQEIATMKAAPVSPVAEPMAMIAEEAAPAGAMADMALRTADAVMAVEDSATELVVNVTQNATEFMAHVSDAVQSVPWWHQPAINWILFGALVMLVCVPLIEYVSRK